MKNVYIVTLGSLNRLPTLQFAFHNAKEARNFMDHVDKQNGASMPRSSLAVMKVYGSASQIIKED
jgi:hypothetical protein